MSELTFQVATASPPGLIANSVLICGERDVLLIDVPFLPPDTQAVVEMVHALGPGAQGGADLPRTP